MTVLAHGIGGRTDLPLPGELVLQAGGFVVLASFLAVGLAWRRSRFMPDRPAEAADPTRRADPAGGAPLGLLVVWGLLLALLGYLVVAAFAGADDLDHNPAPRALYVLGWVGVVPVSLLFGPVWRAVNPLRALHRLLCATLRQPVAGRREPPETLGYWPAAAGLAGFVWLELVPEWRSDPAVVGGVLLGYAVLVTGPAMVFGERWFDTGDPFEVYATLVGALAPVDWAPGRRGPRPVNPLRGIAAIPPAPGLVALLSVWWGSTVFDGLIGTSWWATTSQRAVAGPGVLAEEALATVVLAALVALVAVGYRLATGRRAAELVGTLVPIAVGYTVAHYASLLTVEGPRGLAQLLDPVSAVPPVTEVPAPALVATVQVVAVLTGHVLGVVAAHDRVLAIATTAPRRAEWRDRELADQIPLVVLMITYTVIGLYLLVIA
jgi:hypothetical protein